MLRLLDTGGTGRTGHENMWAIVLAGGAGTRLSPLTTRADGNVVPKQYCSLYGSVSLVQKSIARAASIVSIDRVVVVVAEEHRRWWSRLLADVPPDNIVLQPANRGTAIGILRTLLHVMQAANDASLLFLPSDHYIHDERVLERSMWNALDIVNGAPDTTTLLGIIPESIDTDLGYVVPGPHRRSGGYSVLRFVEKPESDLAIGLLRHGAVWNSFIFATRTRALMRLFERRIPHTVSVMRRAGTDYRAIRALYPKLPTVDFSRDLLEGAAGSLSVLPVAPCGWTDLGTPCRVGACLEKFHGGIQMPAVPEQDRAHLDMSEAWQSFATKTVNQPGQISCKSN